MTLKQLEAFYWAATCVNFAIAAQRSNLSVSSLSKRISELESSLGKPLFDRSGHRARLTEDGSALLPRVKRLLQERDDLRQAFQDQPRLTGSCRFGAGELSALTWIPGFIAQLRRDYPSLRIDGEFGVGAPLEDMVENGELDFILIAGPSSRTRLSSMSLGALSFSWVCSSLCSRQQSLQTPQTLLALYNLASLPASSGVVRLLDEWFAHYGQEPDARFTCNSWGAIEALIVADQALGILPTPRAQALEKVGKLALLRHWPPLAELTYTFQWRRDDSRPLISEARRLAQSMVSFAPSLNSDFTT